MILAIVTEESFSSVQLARNAAVTFFVEDVKSIE
jgi:hypothetical protein